MLRACALARRARLGKQSPGLMQYSLPIVCMKVLYAPARAARCRGTVAVPPCSALLLLMFECRVEWWSRPAAV